MINNQTIGCVAQSVTYVLTIALEYFPQNPDQLLIWCDTPSFSHRNGRFAFLNKRYEQHRLEGIHRDWVRGIQREEDEGNEDPVGQLWGISRGILRPEEGETHLARARRI